MKNNQFLEKLIYDTAVRNAYVLKVKQQMEEKYKIDNMPLDLVILYMQNFIRSIGGNNMQSAFIIGGIKDWFTEEVQLKY